MKSILEIKKEEILKKIKSGENLEIEFKKSKNDIPKDVWETYSAFANTDGGVIILGVSEIGNKLEITGVNNPEKLKKEFWDTINNPSKINRNILTDKDVDIIEIEEIIKLIKDNNSVKNSFIQKNLQISKSKSNRLLNEMIDRKIIKKSGSGKHTFYELEN